MIPDFISARWQYRLVSFLTLSVEIKLFLILYHQRCLNLTNNSNPTFFKIRSRCYTAKYELKRGICFPYKNLTSANFGSSSTTWCRSCVKLSYIYLPLVKRYSFSLEIRSKVCVSNLVSDEDNFMAPTFSNLKFKQDESFITVGRYTHLGHARVCTAYKVEPYQNVPGEWYGPRIIGPRGKNPFQNRNMLHQLNWFPFSIQSDSDRSGSHD